VRSTRQRDLDLYLWAQPFRKKGYSVVRVCHRYVDAHPTLTHQAAMTAYYRGRHLDRIGWQPTTYVPGKIRRQRGRPRKADEYGIGEDKLNAMVIYDAVIKEVQRGLSERQACKRIHEQLRDAPHSTFIVSPSARPLSASTVRDAYKHWKDMLLRRQ
jgi:hypothetical protein